MRTISQNVEVKFVAPTIKDAIIMAQLMNSLKVAIEAKKLVEEFNKEVPEYSERRRYKKIPYHKSIEIDNMEAVYKILHDCGFEDTDPELPKKEWELCEDK